MAESGTAQHSKAVAGNRAASGPPAQGSGTAATKAARESVVPSGRNAASTAAAAGAATQEPPRAALPADPPVFFQCGGAPEICGSVRTAVDQALEKANLPVVRNPQRALIAITANASVLQERVNRDFGTPMATRTYSVELSAESNQGDAVPMPAPRTFSFDATFGRERLDENARLIADDVVEKVRAFWKKKVQ